MWSKNEATLSWRFISTRNFVSPFYQTHHYIIWTTLEFNYDLNKYYPRSLVPTKSWIQNRMWYCLAFQLFFCGVQKTVLPQIALSAAWSGLTVYISMITCFKDIFQLLYQTILLFCSFAFSCICEILFHNPCSVFVEACQIDGSLLDLWKHSRTIPRS